MAWISKETNQFGVMSASEEENNVNLMFNLLGSLMTVNAFAGLAGNVQWESHFNPTQWQGSYQVGDMDAGFGLVQWTPASKIFSALGGSVRDGNAQTMAIYNLTANDWLPTSIAPQTWEEFKTFTGTPEQAALIFLKNYERAGDEHLLERQQYARHWFDYFQGKEPGPGPGPEPGETKRMKIMFYMRRL